MKKILVISALSTVALMLQSCDAIPTSTNPTYPSNPSGTFNQRGFGGNYSNQGDANRAGVFSVQLSQSGTQLSGTATYERGNGESSGVLSVAGNVNGDVANLAFYDQKGNEIARGVLSHNESQYSFIQNSGSNWVPGETIMDRY